MPYGSVSVARQHGRQTRLAPAEIAVGVVADVGVAHLLQGLCGQRAAEIGPAVNDDGGVLAQGMLPDAELQPTAGDVDVIG